MIRFILTILVFTSAHTLFSQWKKIDLPLKEGHRALEIGANASVLFAGSHGSVALYNPKSGLVTTMEIDTADLEFRSAVMVSDSNLLVANAGSPAFIFKSSDGGLNWGKRYENKHPSAFIDGMIALNENHIVAYGDQIDGEFLFLESTDAGNSWEQRLLLPPTDSTEAGFAASNAGMLAVGDTLFVAISGRQSNYVLCSPNKGKTWHRINTALKTGEGSGIFAMAYANGKLVLAGGSYLDYNSTESNIQILDPKTGSLHNPITAPRGYRSGIACHKYLCLSTGTNGTDISYDGGMNWKPLNDERYFSVRYAFDRFYLSGPKGNFATFKIKIK